MAKQLEKEYAVYRKGKTVHIAMKPGRGTWKEVGSKTLKTEDAAKRYHKKKLDELIARFPDNKVRSRQQNE